MIFITDEEYALAEKNGIPRHIVYTRVVTYDWEIDKAITTPVMGRDKRARKHPKKYTDLAIQNGLNLCTFYSRLKKGWSYEDACMKAIPRGQRKTFKYKDSTKLDVGDDS